MSHRIDLIDLRMARGLAAKSDNRGDSDIESAAMKGLLEASRTYTPDKGTWRGYAYMKIKSRITDELRNRTRRNEALMTTEDLTQLNTTVADHAALTVTLDGIPPNVATDFASGHIDRRRIDHRQALETLKEGLE